MNAPFHGECAGRAVFGQPGHGARQCGAQWRYPSDAASGQPEIALEQGQEMGRFLMGSTVVLLFPNGPLRFNPDWTPGWPVCLGEAMAGHVAD